MNPALVDSFAAMRHFFALLLVGLFAGCASVPRLPAEGNFPVPPAPDYRNQQHWAALPTTDDYADLTPGDSLRNRQLTAEADVFFVHPTIYTATRKNNQLWNADLSDEKLNRSVDESTIKNQASIFNSAGRIYAPRYRQAHLEVFHTDERELSQRALDTAYADVRAAFSYYLRNYHRGRPIIIAAHSQGTLHAARLLEEFFVGQPLRDRLVVAYLVGMPIPQNTFADIPVCERSDQTACFVSWRTFREDYELPEGQDQPTLAVVNPLTWTTQPGMAPASLNKGGVLFDFANGPRPNLVNAEIRGAALFASKPRFFGDIFFRTQNYHVGDYNLYWVNVRDNADQRLKGFME